MENDQAQFVVIVGNVVDGVTLHGPFDSFEDADTYAERFDAQILITHLHKHRT